MSGSYRKWRLELTCLLAKTINIDFFSSSSYADTKHAESAIITSEVRLATFIQNGKGLLVALAEQEGFVGGTGWTGREEVSIAEDLVIVLIH